jgi:hypothetical protein
MDGRDGQVWKDWFSTMERALHGRLHHPRSVDQALTRKISLLGVPRRNTPRALPPAAQHDDGPVGGVWGGMFVGPIAQILAGPGRDLTNSAAGSPPSRIPRSNCNPQDGTCRLRQSTITSHSSNGHL